MAAGFLASGFFAGDFFAAGFLRFLGAGLALAAGLDFTLALTAGFLLLADLGAGFESFFFGFEAIN